jgi:hypothetical protein
MRIVLNSRTLVGPQHVEAAAFASEWIPGMAVNIEWLESPSARCVLQVDLPPDSPVVIRGRVLPVDGRDVRSQLEDDLRDHLNFPPYLGDDPSGTEVL